MLTDVDIRTGIHAFGWAAATTHDVAQAAETMAAVDEEKGDVLPVDAILGRACAEPKSDLPFDAFLKADAVEAPAEILSFAPIEQIRFALRSH